jgi:hypothetical protein
VKISGYGDTGSFYWRGLRSGKLRGGTGEAAVVIFVETILRPGKSAGKLRRVEWCGGGEDWERGRMDGWREGASGGYWESLAAKEENSVKAGEGKAFGWRGDRVQNWRGGWKK